MTYLCAAIFVTDIAQARRDIALAAEMGADMVELRIDRFASPGLISEEGIGTLPYILTCRPIWEGGQCDLPDKQRLAALVLAGIRAAYVDIELETIHRVPDALARLLSHQRVIVSAHDFDGRPELLHSLVQELLEVDTAVYKVVWTAQHPRQSRSFRAPQGTP